MPILGQINATFVTHVQVTTNNKSRGATHIARQRIPVGEQPRSYSPECSSDTYISIL
jgi:hypothetical protein